MLFRYHFDIAVSIKPNTQQREETPDRRDKMPISNIIIMGAGPAGLSTALAISQLPSSSPIHITILELRPSTATVAMLGGSINLTPLALRYLDRLGVGDRLRRLGIPVTEKGIELVALRTGAFLGSLWKGADALRVARSDLVACLREAVGKTDGIEIRYGVRVVDVREDGEGAEGSSEVVAVLDDGEEVRGDILLGCDGLHSVARRLYVEPERKEVYSGKVTAYGFAPAEQPADAGVARADGQPALTDSALFTGRYGSIIMSFSEPSRKEIYAAAMMAMEDGHDGKDERDGWKAKGADKAQVKENIMRRFSSTKIPGLDALLGRVEHWTLYPIYMLPPGGRWSRGRVMLLGDAAHAVSQKDAPPELGKLLIMFI